VITFSFPFFCERRRVARKKTAQDARGIWKCAVMEGNNGGDTCYRVNNKNIKRTADPEGRGNEKEDG